MRTTNLLRHLFSTVLLLFLTANVNFAQKAQNSDPVTIIIVSVCERPYLDFGKYKIKLRSDTTITVKNLSLFTSALSFPKPGKGYIKFIVKGKKEVFTIFNTEQSKQLVQEHPMLNSTTVMAVRNAECYLSLTNPEKKVLTVDQLASYLSCSGQYFNWNTDTICLLSSEIKLDSAVWVVKDDGGNKLIHVETRNNCMFLKLVSDLQVYHDISLLLYPHNRDEILIEDISFQDVRTQINAMMRAEFNTDEIVDELTVRCRKEELSEEFIKLLRQKVSLNIKSGISE